MLENANAAHQSNTPSAVTPYGVRIWLVVRRQRDPPGEGEVGGVVDPRRAAGHRSLVDGEDDVTELAHAVRGGGLRIVEDLGGVPALLAVLPTVPHQADEAAGQVLLAGDDDTTLALGRGQPVVGDGHGVGVVQGEHLVVHARHEEARELQVLRHLEPDLIAGPVAFDALPAERAVPLPADQELRLRVVERLAEAFAAIRLAVAVHLVLAGRIDGVVELGVRLAAVHRIELRDGVVILVRPGLDAADDAGDQHDTDLVLADLDAVALGADAAAGIPANGRLKLQGRVLTRPAAAGAEILGERIAVVAVGARVAVPEATRVVVVHRAVAVVVDAVEAGIPLLVAHGRRTDGFHDRVGLAARVRRFGRLGIDLLDLGVDLGARVDLLVVLVVGRGVAVVVVVVDVDHDRRGLVGPAVRAVNDDIELVGGGLLVVAGEGEQTEKGDDDGDRAHGFPPRKARCGLARPLRGGQDRTFN